MSDETKKLNLKLKWQDPQTDESREEVFALPISLGRDSSNTLPLHSSSVSRNHAIISIVEEKIVIKDLGSSNGTKVNGEEIREATLSDGDDIILGKVEVHISFTKGERPKRPSMDHLYGALYEGESEPTISLNSIRDTRGLFANLNDEALTTPKSGEESETSGQEKLSGDALKAFLSGQLQDDRDKDISDDISEVSSKYGRRRFTTADVTDITTDEKRATKDENATKSTPTIDPNIIPNVPKPAPDKPAETAERAPVAEEKSDENKGFWSRIKKLFGG